MIIGVTGGVGAGKSTVLEILKNEFSARLIFCDEVARELQKPGRASYNAICAYFGDEILTSGCGSEIDTKALAKIVFNDEKKLQKLNSMTHPLVKEEVMHLINMYYSKNPSSPVIIEAALLLEAGYKGILDELWCVIADDEVRIKRLEQSRGYSRQRAKDMMAAQKSNAEFIKECDYAIYNSGSIEETRRQISERINYLMR